MENFLSGREHLGDEAQDRPRKDRGHQSAGDAWNVADDDSGSVANEIQGDGGSRVSYVTEEGRVTKIVVTCDCGQVTEIECNYEA